MILSILQQRKFFCLIPVYVREQVDLLQVNIRPIRPAFLPANFVPALRSTRIENLGVSLIPVYLFRLTITVAHSTNSISTPFLKFHIALLRNSAKLRLFIKLSVYRLIKIEFAWQKFTIEWTLHRHKYRRLADPLSTPKILHRVSSKFSWISSFH